MEILTWGTCRVFFFNVLFIFPFIPSLQIVWSVFVYSSFPFITLQKVIFHFLASLLFPYILKLRTCIETLLSFNINRSRNIVSAVKSYQSQNSFYSESLPTCSLQYILCWLHIILKFDRIGTGTPLSFNIIKSSNVAFLIMLSQSQSRFSSESSPTCFLQYIVHLLHIILKFAFLLWQVPRSSVGRALYRESGPSLDGDPDLGNLPFSFFFFLFPSLQIVWSVFVYPYFLSLNYRRLSSIYWQVYSFPLLLN